MEAEAPNKISEIQRFRRGINDLVGVLSLPAIWLGGEGSLVGPTLLDALVRMLRLDFAYMRVSESGGTPPFEWARFGDGIERATSAHHLGEALRRYLAEGAETAGRVANPLAEGTVSIAVFRLGLLDRVGQLAAVSRRSDFPTDIERLVLQVATNQAGIALQERRNVRQLRLAAEKLEQRVAERTERLAAANETLRREAAEHERSEKALRETEDRLRRMADSIAEVVWIMDLEPEERVVYTSPSFERVWGLPLEDLYRNPRLWTESIHPEDRERVGATFSEWIAGADVRYQDVEFRIVRPDGTVRWIHERGVLTVNDQGKPTRVSGISTDVTDRKLAELELETAFAQIQALKDRLHRENIALREEVEEASMFEEIVGVSAPLRSVLSQMSRVAPTDSTVLITGETGTGKELVARAIHKLSLRSARALVSVNCAAIPPSLIASELFGHEKGAFTGALQRRQGRFELADGGTIFLDEVGELPAETQVTLLRVLQEREFERVGGSRPIRTDVRVIAASNRDLEAAVAQNAFRADLFYRLNVFPLEMPALRDRRADIPVLVEYFIHRYARRAGKKIHGISKASLDLLRSYDWPGNVRELQNVVERAVIVSDSETLSIDERWLTGRPRTPHPPEAEHPQTLATHEKVAIEDTLAETRGRVAGPFGAAARLGIPSSTLESKIRALKIDKKRFKAAPPASPR
jgi:formate hydrogenlyase transcriptional activator